jgi:tetratricopeptide (TPR) repeat protein
VRRATAALLCAFAVACASAPRPGAGLAREDAGAGDAGLRSSADVSPDGGPSALADAGVLDAGVAGPSQAFLDLSRKAEAKYRDGDTASLAEAASLWEQAALETPHPEVPLLSAAQAWRERAQRPDAALDDVQGDAGACGADAERGLEALDPQAHKGSRSEAIARVGPAGVELLYVGAVCKGLLARARGFTQLVEAQKDLAEALERVAQLAPDLDDAGAERELGRLYAALPSASGGDLAEARRHFDAAVERAPGSVRNRVAYATSIAVKAQDRALFEAQLRAALEAHPDDAEARELLSREDELFGPAEAAQPVPGGPPIH